MNHDESTPVSDREQLAAAILAELRGLRAELQEIAGRLTRVEKRVVHVYPALAAKKKPKADKSKDSLTKEPSITAERALELYDRLAEKARGGAEAEVMVQLQAMEEADLKLMATELGSPMAKRPSKKALVEAIAGRIKQSILLTRHVSRPTSDPGDAQRREREGSNQG